MFEKKNVRMYLDNKMIFQRVIIVCFVLVLRHYYDALTFNLIFLWLCYKIILFINL